ncbi:MAG: hypothetical protein ACE5G2_11225, partial [Candidatus Krumholzibacteriia bacterium]
MNPVLHSVRSAARSRSVTLWRTVAGFAAGGLRCRRIGRRSASGLRTPGLRGFFLPALFLETLCFGAVRVWSAGSPSCAEETQGWLRAAIPPPAPASGTVFDPRQQFTEASFDLVVIYRHTLGLDPADQALLARMQAAREAVRRSASALPGAAAFTSDEIQAASARLLRLRALEEMALRTGREADGLRDAAAADSLELGMAVALTPLHADELGARALVAGLRPSRAQRQVLHRDLYAMWRRHFFAPTPSKDGSFELLLFHLLAPRDERVVADARIRLPGSRWQATLHELADEIAAGRLAPFTADDPGRRLLLALRTLVREAMLPEWTLGTAERITVLDVVHEAPYGAAIAALDSLEEVSALLPSRSPAHEGTRAVRGSARPSTGDVHGDSLAIGTLRRALRELRGRFGSRLLARLGVRVSAAAEVVPGQQVAALWSLVSKRSQRFHAWRARIGTTILGAHDPPEEVAPESTYVFRSGYASIPRARPGVALGVHLGLRFALEGWGEVLVSDRAVVRVVAPVQATLDLAEGAVVRRGPVRVVVHVTSRSPVSVEGAFRVLATANWSIAPARVFGFRLRRPGQSVHQQLELSLPVDSSPGPYRLALRLEVDGNDAGTLSTTLVKPFEWVVIGPFREPPPGRLLAPERGVNLEKLYPGAV